MQYPEHNLVTQQFPPGTVVKHYKGGMYIVVGYAREEASLGLLVLYKSFPAQKPDSDGIPWSRPASEFIQTMRLPAQEGEEWGRYVARFTKVAIAEG